MIHPKAALLQKVSPGTPVLAEHYNALVDAVKLSLTGPNVAITGAGYHIRDKVVGQSMMAKFVIIRPPVVLNAIEIQAEDAVRHPDYSVEGDNFGRWIGSSEHPTSPINTLQSYPVYPHQTGLNYNGIAWDGLTRVRQTVIGIAMFVGDVWYIVVIFPWVPKRRPHNTIKTPCSPQEALPS